jgi:hypothetical protein
MPEPQRAVNVDAGCFYCPYIPTIFQEAPMPKSDTIDETLRVPIKVIEEFKRHDLDVEKELTNILKAFVDEEMKKLVKTATPKELPVRTILCLEIIDEIPKHKPLPKVDIGGLQGFDSGVQSYCPTLQGSLNDSANLPGRRRSS